MTLAADLGSALAALIETMAVARHDWWVVSGTAAWLYGCAEVPERDIDVLFDLRDVRRIGADSGLVFGAELADGHFRSQAFATQPGRIATEFFAGFEVSQGGRWITYQPADRCWRSYAGLILPVPSPAELIRLLTLMGRPKDLARAARLSARARFPSTADSV